MSIKTLKTDHTGIIVGDLDYSVDFFTKVLDYRLLDRGTRQPKNQSKVTGLPNARAEIAYVANNDHALELICYKESEGTETYKPRPFDIGHWHLSLYVENIFEAQEKAEAFGLKPVAGKITVDSGPNKGNQIIYLAMPDGVIIEFVQPGRS